MRPDCGRCRFSADSGRRCSACAGSNRTSASSTSRSSWAMPTLCAKRATCRSTCSAPSAGRQNVELEIRRARHGGSSPAVTRAQTRGSRWASSSASAIRQTAGVDGDVQGGGELADSVLTPLGRARPAEQDRALEPEEEGRVELVHDRQSSAGSRIRTSARSQQPARPGQRPARQRRSPPDARVPVSPPYLIGSGRADSFRGPPGAGRRRPNA